MNYHEPIYLINMKKLFAFFALLCLIYPTAQAQKTATWKGGTPGRNTEWNCATNWKEGRIPDEFSNVIIPDVSTSTFSYPIIYEGVIEIFSLQCAPSARLNTLSKAHIIMLDVPVAIRAVQVNDGLVYTGAPPSNEIADRH
ncbi:MAG: hypothetical protein H7246_02880 [Phycisphaerae bacterium]|nr:hypothetical protein [Saprospiraceae bacterium]